MKTIYSICALQLLVSAVSCSSYYHVVTEVRDDLSVERRVHADLSDDSSVFPAFVSSGGWKHSKLSESFESDFYNDVLKMTDVFVCECDSLSQLKFFTGDGNDDDPLFCPEENVVRRFRWFYTYYDYSAIFKGLNPRLPLPLEGYLDENRRELFFRGGTVPPGWNGIEMYLVLDDVNHRFAEWYSDAVYIVMCDIFEPYCTAGQNAFMDAFRKEFMERTGCEMMFAVNPEEFALKMDELAPEMGFGDIYDENKDSIEAVYDEESAIFDYFESSFVYVLDMPGKYTGGNAGDFQDGMPKWKVDAYRLMYGDLILEATFRKVNVWVFILTFALLALFLQTFAKLYNR